MGGRVQLVVNAWLVREGLLLFLFRGLLRFQHFGRLRELEQALLLVRWFEKNCVASLRVPLSLISCEVCKDNLARRTVAGLNQTRLDVLRCDELGSCLHPPCHLAGCLGLHLLVCVKHHLGHLCAVYHLLPVSLKVGHGAP